MSLHHLDLFEQPYHTSQLPPQIFHIIKVHSLENIYIQTFVTISLNRIRINLKGPIKHMNSISKFS